MVEKKQLETIVNELTKSANPSEEGFNTLLESCNSEDAEIRQYLAQHISHFISKIPSLAEEALEAQLKLADDSEDSVKSFGIRNLFEYSSVNPEKVVMKLISILQNCEGIITTVIKSNFRQNLANSNHVFLDSFITVLKDKSRTDEEKNTMVKILMDYFEFSAETKEQLITAIDASLDADTVYAVKLIRKYSANLSPKERDDRINRFLNDLYIKLSKDDEESYINAMHHIFNPACASIPFREGTAGQRLFSIIAEQVFPKLYLLDDKTQTISLRIIADDSRFANETSVKELIPSLYENVFKQIGTYFKSVFVIEPILFMMNTLVKAAPYMMTEVFGIVFISDGVTKPSDDSKKSLISVVISFIQNEVNHQIDSSKKDANEAPEEEKKKLTNLADAVEKSANNCYEFSLWLSSKTPMTEKKPKMPSWSKNKENKAKQNPQPKYRKTNFRNDRNTNFRGNRGRRNDNYNHRERRGDYGNEENANAEE